MERETGPGRGLFWVTNTTTLDDLPTKVREILALKDCYWLPGWDADTFMKELCAWPGIGLGIPNPIEWTKGMEAILPDEAQKLLRSDSDSPLSSPIREQVPASVLPLAGPSEVAADWHKEAETLLDRGRYDAAHQLLSDHIDEVKSSFPALRLWVIALDKTNRKEDALTEAQFAVENFPNEPQAHVVLAQMLSGIGRTAESVAEYRRSLELENNPYIKTLLGIELNRGSRLDEAAAVFSELAAETDQQDIKRNALAWLGVTLYDLGKHDEAIDKLRQAVEIDPKNAFPIYFWSRSLEALGRTEEAAEKLAQYQALQPDGGKSGTSK
jgi:tetratricopeptide (TPR) repeat protein